MATDRVPLPAEPQREIDRDLGIGSRVAGESQERFLNRDGSFNAERRGLSFLRSQNTYHAFLTMTWSRFFSLLIVAYFATNLLFAVAYTAAGPGALVGAEATTLGGRFLESFFFSVQTLATIGYGHISPHGMLPNALVTIEALVGLLGLTLATGLLYARFSRPSARILFSENAIIAPYKGITAFEFRIANERSNELIDVEATVTLSRNEAENAKTVRRFYPLALERRSVMFFPLQWVIVHPIDEQSPLRGVTKELLEASDAEFLILLKGTDETFSQTVHARSSYKFHEVVWGVKFKDMFNARENGKVSIDLRRIHDIEPAV